MVKLALGYEAILDEVIAEVCDGFLGEDPALIVLHPAVMQALIDEMKAAGSFYDSPCDARPPFQYKGVPMVADPLATEPQLITTTGATLAL